MNTFLDKNSNLLLRVFDNNFEKPQRTIKATGGLPYSILDVVSRSENQTANPFESVRQPLTWTVLKNNTCRVAVKRMQ